MLNRYLSAEILFVHVGHGVLFWAVLAILALSLPWWASLALTPLAVFSVAGWAYEGVIIWPVITRLWRGEGKKEQGARSKDQDWDRSGDETDA